MLARQHQGSDVHAGSSAAFLNGLYSVAMCETLYAEVDLIGTVADLVNRRDKTA